MYLGSPLKKFETRINREIIFNYLEKDQIQFEVFWSNYRGFHQLKDNFKSNPEIYLNHPSALPPIFG